MTLLLWKRREVLIDWRVKIFLIGILISAVARSRSLSGTSLAAMDSFNARVMGLIVLSVEAMRLFSQPVYITEKIPVIRRAQRFRNQLHLVSSFKPWPITPSLSELSLPDLVERNSAYSARREFQILLSSHDC